MSHDRGCWKCHRDQHEYADCKLKNCVKRRTLEMSRNPDAIYCRNTGQTIAYHMGQGRECLCGPGVCSAPDGSAVSQVPKKSIGAAVFTTIRLALPNGQFEDIQVVSADAVMAVLRNPCVRKLETGEPFFVLRGQDRSAPYLVEEWVNRNGVHASADKVADALRIASAMHHWPRRRTPT